MSESASDIPAPPRRLLDRIGNPLDWSDGAKCALAAGGVLSFLVPLWIVLRFILEDPSLVTGIDRIIINLAYLPHFLWVLSWLGAAWLAIALAGLLLRHRPGGTRPLIHATCQLYWVHAAYTAYAYGPYTNPVGLLMALAGLIFALIFFGRHPTLLGMATFWAILTGTTVAEMWGRLPSAPYFGGLPYGQPPRSLAMYVAIVGFAALLAFLTFLFDLVIHRWRQREEEVKEAKILLEASNDQLSKATSLIRRYVPTQLAEQIIGSGVAPEAYERRVLTVFFSDIRGFTEIAERLDAGTLSRILNDYLSEMVAIARKWGGTLDKFVGDAVMVFFGAPEPMAEKDQGLRCVRMAQEMQAKTGELQGRWLAEEFQIGFEIRIGINTGPVHVGNFGASDRMDYTVIGHHVNLAARLESACQPGRILLSEATYGLVQDEIPCQGRGEVTAKGIREPVPVWEVGE